MNPTQEEILDLLNNGHLSITKSSSVFERQVFEWLKDNDLMAAKTDSYISITSEGYHFIKNAQYFNPVPLNVHDWILEIIEQVKDDEAILKASGKLHYKAYTQLLEEGIIETGRKTSSTKLTSKGRSFIRSGKSLYEFLDSHFQPSIRIGHNIGGDVHGSDLNINLPSSPNNTNSKEKNKTPIIQIIYWLIGIAATIGGLLQLLHANHVWIF